MPLTPVAALKWAVLPMQLSIGVETVRGVSYGVVIVW